MALVSTRTQH